MICRKLTSVARRSAPRANCFSRLLEDKTEYFAPKDQLDLLAVQVADKLACATHAVAFCGAGLSTKSGIPDYRSGYQTVLATGPGKWESDQNKAKHLKPTVIRRGNDAWPNDGHRALAALVQHGYLKAVLSQNVDGLIHRSGVPLRSLVELHGNIFNEECQSCHREHWKDFVVPDWSRTDHFTGRTCDCDARTPTRDSIVYFKEKLSQAKLASSKAALQQADYCLVIGSSLQVNPAAHMVDSFFRQHQPDCLALLNLQKTKLHGIGATEIHFFCDTFLLKVTDLLHVRIIDNLVHRWLALDRLPDGNCELRFSDFEDKVVDACSEARLFSSRDSSLSTLLSHWPMRLLYTDLLQFDSAELKFHFLPGRHVTVPLADLIAGKRYRFSFKYDMALSYDSFAVF